MQSFNEFLNTIREDDTGHLNPIDREEVKELFRIAFDRYKKELTDFLRELARQNEDEQLSELVKRLGDSGRDMTRFRKGSDKPEVVPFTADSGSDEDNPFGGGGGQS